MWGLTEEMSVKFFFVIDELNKVRQVFDTLEEARALALSLSLDHQQQGGEAEEMEVAEGEMPLRPCPKGSRLPINLYAVEYV